MDKQKLALVYGAGGMIGSNLVRRLKEEGFWVRGVDLKYPEYWKSEADEFIIGDLRDKSIVRKTMFSPNQESIIDKINSFDEVYQLAADFGGAQYIFSQENDADVMHNSCQINLNTVDIASKFGVKKVFFSSSACIFPSNLQEDVINTGLREIDAIPANPDSCYGWNKLHDEFLYMAYNRNKNLDVRIARFHNIFGQASEFDNIRAKAPSQLCYKVASTPNGGEIEVLGDGLQTRSFMDCDELLIGMRKLIDSSYTKPLNLGSSELISINDLAKMIIKISGKNITIKNIPTQVQGVRGRNSNNDLCEKVLGWKSSQPLEVGIKKLYNWVNQQVNEKNKQL